MASALAGMAGGAVMRVLLTFVGGCLCGGGLVAACGLLVLGEPVPADEEAARMIAALPPLDPARHNEYGYPVYRSCLDLIDRLQDRGAAHDERQLRQWNHCGALLWPGVGVSIVGALAGIGSAISLLLTSRPLPPRPGGGA